MDNELWALAKWIIGGFITMFVAIGAYMLKAMRNDTDTLLRSQNALELKVSEEYATKTDLNAARIEQTASIQRVHEKIEEVDTRMDRKLTDVQTDIKALLRRP